MSDSKTLTRFPRSACESRTYSLSLRASNPAGSAARRPGRPAARSITASTCRASPARPAAARALRTTRVCSGPGATTRACARSRTPARRRSSRRPRPTPAASESRNAASSRSNPAVRASDSATPRPVARSISGITLRRTATRRNAGSRFIGSRRGRRPSARQNASVSARRTSSSGRTSRGADGPDAGHGIQAAAAERGQQHGLGLVVQRVAGRGQARRPVSLHGAVQRRVPDRPGPCLHRLARAAAARTRARSRTGRPARSA